MLRTSRYSTLYVSISIYLLVFLCGEIFGVRLSFAQAETAENPTANLSFQAPTGYLAYVPEKREYMLELGGMWEENNLYWISMGVGFHVGRCIFTQSYTCQQYIDLIGGVGGRDGLTTGLAMLSPRWQFVHFPSHISPYVRLIGGGMNIRDNNRDRTVFTYGLGYGIAASVHRNLDIKWELRTGVADEELWSQTFVVFGVKVDQWVDHFATKLKSLGLDTVDTTGKIIKGTITAPVKVYDWMNQPQKPSASDK